MAEQRDDSKKKTRVTSEDLTKIKRLYREGMSISDIATEVGFHRHTIRKHLQEKYEDIVAEEARRQVLAEELGSHFKQLKSFALNDLKARLDASVPRLKRSGKPRTPGPIDISGLLGLPCMDTAIAMSEEWVRMYKPSPREDHLLKSLRQHTEDLALWISWDRWRRKVSTYEKASRYLWTWLEERLEEAILEKIDPQKVESTMRWTFGNILTIADGREPGDLDIFRRSVFDPPDTLMGHDPNKDTDGSQASFQYLSGILLEAQNMSQWEELKSATAELGNRESQLELRRLARDIDYDLVNVELMGAFSGHCPLCPV